MRKVAFSLCAALAVSAAPALAADLGRVVKAPVAAPAAPIWDIAFGGALMTDYNFRGISQSDRGPSVNAYFEPRFNINPNLQLYAGIAGYAVNLPTQPTAEIDIYGGIRPTFGPLALDFGVMYYYYPREVQQFGPVSFTLTDTDFWEVYAKGTWTFNDMFSAGAAVYYTDSWLNSGAEGTYLSGTAKINLPSGMLPKDFGWYISGELAHYFLGTTKFDPVAFPIPFDLPDYTTWNIGLGLTYKIFTLDFRYHDTDLSREECFLLTADPGASSGGAISVLNPGGFRSRWCSSALIAKLSGDLTAMTHLK